MQRNMEYTKEDLQKMTGVYWTDYNVEILNAMLKAHREGKKLYVMPNMYPRQGKRLLAKTFDTICAAEGKRSDYKTFDVFTREDMKK